MSLEAPPQAPAQQGGDVLRNLLLDIVLPVVILNQMSKRLGDNGPLLALLVALSFPLGHGAYSWLKEKKKNFLSLLGMVNILLTGGLALLKLEGGWFAVKEAFFPLVIGLVVTISAYTSRPLVQLLLLNRSILKVDLIYRRIKELRFELPFEQHLRRLTLYLGGSFFLSAALNYYLARRIFTEIAPNLSPLDRSAILNAQIAQMTWLSFLVIALPSMLIMAGIFWYLITGIKKYAGLDLKDVMIGAD